MGRRSVIRVYHLMFLPVWHLFGLKPGKLVRLRCQQCVQQPDCSQKDRESGRERLIIWVFPPTDMWAGPWRVILVDDRMEKKV